MALELEHMVGFNGAARTPLHVHPNGSDLVYAQGGCVVISDLRDPHNQSFLRGHDDMVTCLAMSSSGRLLASGQAGDNSDVIVWDFETKREVYRLQEHDHGVVAVEMSADERFLLTVGNERDRKLVVWDLLTGCIVVIKSNVKVMSTCACWGGRKKDAKRRETTQYQLATGGASHLSYWTFDPMAGTLAAEDCSLGNQVRTFCSLAFSHDGEYVFAGSASGDFIAVHVKYKTLHSITAACSNGVQSIVALRSEMGDRVIVGGGDGTVSIFEGLRDGANHCRAYNRGRISSSTIQLSGRVNALQLLHPAATGTDPVRLLGGTDHGCIYSVEMAFDGGEARKSLLLESHPAPIRAVAYPPDPTGNDAANASSLFATCSDDGTVRVWDAVDYRVLAKAVCQPQKTGCPTSLAFSGEVMFTGWEDGKIRAHEAEHGNLLWEIAECHRGGVTALALSNNLKFLVSGGEEGEVRVWEIRTREMFLHLKHHKAAVTSLQLFADDTHVLSAGRDRSIYLWDLHAQARAQSYDQRMGAVNCIAIHPDQTQLLSVGQERKVSFWDLRQTTPVSMIDVGRPSSEQLCVAINREGSMFAAAGVDCTVRLWRLQDATLLCEGSGHSGAVRSLLFSPDSKQLVSVGNDGGILIWNVFPE